MMLPMLAMLPLFRRLLAPEDEKADQTDNRDDGKRYTDPDTSARGL